MGYWAAYKRKFFSHNPDRDAWLYLFLLILVISYCIICFISEFLISCDGRYVQHNTTKWKNPKYHDAECLDKRSPKLLGLTLRECDFGRRIFISIVLGAIVGFERRAADRPAGIRTMSLTSLGACAFTLSSMFSFESSSMSWDSSRVSAAIPSGVGFLGAGLIWKGFVDGSDTHRVYGLTTAASIWLSAAIGVASGGALYFLAFFVTTSVVVMLRFGPRMPHTEEDEGDETENEDEHGEHNFSDEGSDLEQVGPQSPVSINSGGSYCSASPSPRIGSNEATPLVESGGFVENPNRTKRRKSGSKGSKKASLMSHT